MIERSRIEVVHRSRAVAGAVLIAVIAIAGSGCSGISQIKDAAEAIGDMTASDDREGDSEDGDGASSSPGSTEGGGDGEGPSAQDGAASGTDAVAVGEEPGDDGAPEGATDEATSEMPWHRGQGPWSPMHYRIPTLGLSSDEPAWTYTSSRADDAPVESAALEAEVVVACEEWGEAWADGGMSTDELLQAGFGEDQPELRSIARRYRMFQRYQDVNRYSWFLQQLGSRGVEGFTCEPLWRIFELEHRFLTGKYGFSTTAEEGDLETAAAEYCEWAGLLVDDELLDPRRKLAAFAMLTDNAPFGALFEEAFADVPLSPMTRLDTRTEEAGEATWGVDGCDAVGAVLAEFWPEAYPEHDVPETLDDAVGHIEVAEELH